MEEKITKIENIVYIKSSYMAMIESYQSVIKLVNSAKIIIYIGVGLIVIGFGLTLKWPHKR
jgi:hypothetical protein